MMHTIAGKAVCFGQALQPDFSRYAHQVVENCQVMASELSEAGMRLVSGGGTDNHLILVDVTPLGITGRQAEQALEFAGIIANKNAIPFDSRPTEGDERTSPGNARNYEPRHGHRRGRQGGVDGGANTHEH